MIIGDHDIKYKMYNSMDLAIIFRGFFSLSQSGKKLLRVAILNGTVYRR